MPFRPTRPDHRPALPPPPGRQLFIYWRTPAAQRDAATAAAQRMQQALRAAHPGLVATLYLRRDEAAAPAGAADPATPQATSHATLMETYALPGPGIGPGVQAAIEAAGTALQPWLQGARHVEVFEPLP